METEKTCENCDYFRRHYVLVTCYFSKLRCGHCGNTSIRKTTFEKNFPKACAKWKESRKTEKTYISIKKALLDITRTVRNIANIFENDKELYERQSLLPVQEPTEILTTQTAESARGEKDSAEKFSRE